MSNFSVIEVASGEYGKEYIDKMIETIDNGRVSSWEPANNDCYIKVNREKSFSMFEEEINPNNLKFKCSAFEQFMILFRRSSKQIYRNRVSCSAKVFNLILIENFPRVISTLEYTCTSSWESSSEGSSGKWETTQPKLFSILDFVLL
jgi:hypothetical protein